MLPRNRKGQSRQCQRLFRGGKPQRVSNLFVINLRLSGASGVQDPTVVITIETTAH